MGANLSPEVLADLIKHEQLRRAAENSLYEFVKQSWATVEPGVPFIPSWHIEEICTHLEAVSNGEIRRLLINIPPRHALRLGTPIPTTNGFKAIEDVQPGDFVFGVSGQPTQVLGKSEVFTARDIYRCWTDDRTYIDTDGEHLWTVRLTRDLGIFHTYTTEQLWMREQGWFLRTKRGGGVDMRPSIRSKDFRQPMLPDAKAAVYPEKELPIPPYVLGSWLGDGSSHDSRIACHISDQPETRAAYEALGVKTTDQKHQDSFGCLGMRDKLRSLNLLQNKHIPQQYLEASVTQRFELLRGLMDTDGCASKSGQLIFSQKKEAFVDQFCELLRSLGIKAFKTEHASWIGEKSYGTQFLVTFHAQDIFKLQRKEARTKKTERKFGRYLKVEKLEVQDKTQCLAVAAPDGLFQAGRGYICTHNSKSTIVSVMWPMWEWIKAPEQKFLAASYSGTLSIRDNLKARRLIQSPWYQERWGHVFTLSGDQNAKQRFENNKTGYRIATSVGGTATGEGGSRLVLDDPHGAQDAQSEAMRNSSLEWFDQVWSTRLNNPKTDAMVTVMQRLHEKDISGHILTDLSGWEHICIPAEWDCTPRKTSLGGYDPRTKEGELICPARFGLKEIAQLKISLGVYGSAGQLQQRPSPAGGGILKTSNFKLWPASRPIPDLFFIVQSYDTAFTEKTSGDPTGCCVWGIFEHDKRRHVLLLDCWNEHLGYPTLKKRVIDDWQARYGGEKNNILKPSRKADVILVEAKGSGQSLLQDLRMSNIPVVPYNPGRADKISRAHLVAPLLESGVFWVLESNKNKGCYRTWVEPFMKQLEQFPAGEHDEMVDCLTQAAIYLRDVGHLEVTVVADEDPDERDYHAAKQLAENPYA